MISLLHAASHPSPSTCFSICYLLCFVFRIRHYLLCIMYYVFIKPKREKTKKWSTKKKLFFLVKLACRPMVLRCETTSLSFCNRLTLVSHPGCLVWSVVYFVWACEFHSFILSISPQTSPGWTDAGSLLRIETLIGF